jgi:hypothetical protein
MIQCRLELHLAIGGSGSGSGSSSASAEAAVAVAAVATLQVEWPLFGCAWDALRAVSGGGGARLGSLVVSDAADGKHSVSTVRHACRLRCHRLASFGSQGMSTIQLLLLEPSPRCYAFVCRCACRYTVCGV